MDVEYPLHAVVKTGYVDAITRLLDTGAEVDQTARRRRRCLACLEGRVDAARLLDRGAEVK